MPKTKDGGYALDEEYGMDELSHLLGEEDTESVQDIEYLDDKMQATTKERAAWIKVIKDGKVTYTEMPQQDGSPDA